MDSRESRYWLRIETGANMGEESALSDGVHSIGRRSENDLVLSDASVSGRHAEIRSEGNDLLLVDLGSTNGTKVAGERIESHRLAHGDHFLLGSVEIVFLDAHLAEAPPPASPGEEVGRIQGDRAAPSNRRGILLLALLVVVAVGAGGTWWLRNRGEEGPAVTRVPEVPGNLLADGTFEAGAGGPDWVSAETAPQSFYRDRGFAATGGLGMGVALEEGEWVLARSPSFAVGLRSAFELRASLAAEDDARARVGIRFESSSAPGSEFVVWSRVVEPSADFVEVELVFAGLPGYDRASVVLAGLAEGGGVVAVDDVSVVPSDRAAKADARFNEFEARLFGPGSTTATFVRSGHVLFTGIDFAPWSEAARSGWGAGSWTARESADGLDYTCSGAPPDAVLELTLNTAERGGNAGRVRLAAIGADGYRSLASEFEIGRATSLLLGQGVDLVRLWFDEPVRITGAMREGAMRIRATMGGLDTFHLQLTFVEERNRARELAVHARDKEKRQEYGAVLDAWSTLLDEVPFDAELVTRAEEARARLVQQGMERVEEIRREVERARFFALPELYRQCRARAVAVGGNYGSSGVAVEASALVGEIDGELATLEAATPNAEREKLRSVFDAIKEDEAPDLKAHVGAALGSREGSEDDN